MTNIQRNHRIIAETLRPPASNAEVAINFDGFDLIVRGDYTPKEWDLQPEDFDVTEVYLADSAIDVSELFDADALAIAVLHHMRKERESCEEIT